MGLNLTFLLIIVSELHMSYTTSWDEFFPSGPIFSFAGNVLSKRGAGSSSKESIGLRLGSLGTMGTKFQELGAIIVDCQPITPPSTQI